MKSLLHSTSFFRGLAVLLLMTAGPRLFSLDPDGAWKKAREARDLSEGLSPGMMRMVSLELDKDGGVVTREEQLSKISYAPDGTPKSEVLNATKDGKDVTEEKRAEAAKQNKRSGGQGPMGGGFEMPDPLARGAEKSLKLGPARIVKEGGRSYWEFPFKMKAGSLFSTVGAVRVDSETGLPLSVEYSFEPLPPGVKKAAISMRYSSPDGLRVIPASAAMSVDSSLIFFKKKIEMTMEFSEYVMVENTAAKKN
jgi:hypothetical protein